MTWGQQFSALAKLNDDDGAWEAEYGRLKDAWCEAYTVAFIEIAVARGWRRENAETWPSEIIDDAFIEASRYEWDPRQTAEADVIGCEEEPA